MGLIYVGLGGFLGSCLRYMFTIVLRNAGNSIPFGTLLSNVIAGLLIGFIIGADRQAGLISPQIRLFLVTGLLGGLSTFSTFSLETIDLFLTGRYFFGALNILLNLSLSFLGVVIGMTAARVIVFTA